MKREIFVFVVAALIGYAGFTFHPQREPSAKSAGPSASSARASSAREIDMVAEYQDMMLTDAEKLELALHQANRLSELLGLAEKWGAEEAISDQLAKLYPREALNYYITYPTNADMNRTMYDQVLCRWAELDWNACFAYLNASETVDDDAFSHWWGQCTDPHFAKNPEDCCNMFQRFSKKRQNDVIMSGISDEMRSALLPLMKDAEFAAKTAAEIADRNQRHAARMEDEKKQENQPKSASQMEDERCGKWMKKWRKQWPDSAEVLAAIKEMESRDNRRNLLEFSMKPRAEADENPQAWLARISALMTQAGEIPRNPPDTSSSDDRKTYDLALAEWLPQQEPKLQRAWAETVIYRMDTDEAFSYIEKLSTKSLRADMRDKKWTNWASRDAKAAAQAMVKLATPAEMEAHLPEAFYQWALRDYTNAKQWLDTQADSSAKSAALKKIQP